MARPAASMRSVLEETSLADVAAGPLPEHVGKLAVDYLDQSNSGRAQRAFRCQLVGLGQPPDP